MTVHSLREKKKKMCNISIFVITVFKKKLLVKKELMSGTTNKLLSKTMHNKISFICLSTLTSTTIKELVLTISYKNYLSIYPHTLSISACVSSSTYVPLIHLDITDERYGCKCNLVLHYVSE